ncbi:hypothetical protein [Mycobacteroides abscessus]|uniref:Uncharacterized protein n=1 Tax=Mycobacteroides abscessus subsp. bolletii CRM-0020 TaxID=1306401 RepID=A0A829HQV7_9MYCO|nr:hypothetical protein [Mycobacteroides abscessus]EPQ21013.1 hypothetical protein J108_23675 [Mycobacteroides abscessus subsp. bolletii CRM-0020]MBN7488293.1 hypothetical protein [Mycobacteroides abscessus subsp. abscessus]SKR75765.1 Uncharacterised protein [Mycobacteroides abscessus subsp. massiliense]
MSGTESPKLSREQLAAAFQADIESDIELVLDVQQLQLECDDLAAQLTAKVSEARAKHAEAATRPRALAQLKEAGLDKAKLDRYDSIVRSVVQRQKASASASKKAGTKKPADPPAAKENPAPSDVGGPAEHDQESASV